ncbi:MAG: hypothetical protein JST96_09265, partial [Bacteroidetes bacterium]|nr:hypothetical protein [Bacteroidota bacterium]
MKYILSTIIFFALHATCTCQSAGNISASGSSSLLSSGFSRPATMIDPSWRTETIQNGANWNTFNGIRGNPFYNDSWQKGYVVLQGNRVAKDVLLNFNIYKNQVYYWYDSQAYVLDESAQVKEFAFRDKEDSDKMIVFRSGYPPVGNNTKGTFYEIVV